MAKNPVTYAEVDLEVHDVYKAAFQESAKYEEQIALATRLRNERRSLEVKLADLEMDLLAAVYAANPDGSQAARDRALKSAVASDPETRRVNEEIRVLSSRLDECEGLKTILKVRLEILTARMVELGGYFQYLAVAKIASMQGTAQPTAPSGSPWG